MHLHQADSAAEVAESHQLFVHYLQGQWHVGQIFRGAHRLPEAPEVLAARRSRPNVSQLALFLGHLAVVVRPIRGIEERSSRCHGDNLP